MTDTQTGTLACLNQECLKQLFKVQKENAKLLDLICSAMKLRQSTPTLTPTPELDTLGDDGTITDYSGFHVGGNKIGEFDLPSVLECQHIINYSGDMSGRKKTGYAFLRRVLDVLVAKTKNKPEYVTLFIEGEIMASRLEEDYANEFKSFEVVRLHQHKSIDEPSADKKIETQLEKFIKQMLLGLKGPCFMAFNTTLNVREGSYLYKILKNSHVYDLTVLLNDKNGTIHKEIRDIVEYAVTPYINDKQCRKRLFESYFNTLPYFSSFEKFMEATCCKNNLLCCHTWSVSQKIKDKLFWFNPMIYNYGNAKSQLGKELSYDAILEETLAVQYPNKRTKYQTFRLDSMCVNPAILCHKTSDPYQNARYIDNILESLILEKKVEKVTIFTQYYCARRFLQKISVDRIAIPEDNPPLDVIDKKLGEIFDMHKNNGEDNKHFIIFHVDLCKSLKESEEPMPSNIFNLFHNGRHYGLGYLVFDNGDGNESIGPSMRSNLDYIFLGSNVDTKAVDKAHQNYFPMYASSKDFKEGYSALIADGYEMVNVNREKNTGVKKFKLT